MLPLLLAIAIAPGIAISIFVYSLREFGKKAWRQLLFSFLLGMAATIPPLLIQTWLPDVRDDPARHSILSFAIYAYIIIALTEEGSKYLVLRTYAFRQPTLRTPFDGILYSVMIGMGFATVENIEYVWQFGLETGVSRFFLAVPAHASFAVLMGYNIGYARMKKLSANDIRASGDPVSDNRGTDNLQSANPGPDDRETQNPDPAKRHEESPAILWRMWKGLLTAVFFHGSFDFFLFLQQKRFGMPYAGMLAFGSFASFYIAVRMAMRAIRMHVNANP